MTLLMVVWAITKGIELVVKAFDNYIHRVEKLQEAMQNAAGEYESAKSSLESLNSELEEQNKKIDELKSKGKLTYAEKGQLEELEQITEELALQKEIAEWQLENTRRDAAMKAAAYVNEKYNLDRSKINDVKSLTSGTMSEEDLRSLNMAADGADPKYLAVSYRIVSDELDNLIAKRKELSNGSRDAILLDDEISSYRTSIQDVKKEIDGMLLSLMEQRANMQDYYDSIKDTPYDEMSYDAQLCYDTMSQINSAIRTLYYGLGNNRFNSEAISEIFNTDGIEMTKDQLIEMAKAGTLTPAAIASHKKLAEAVLNASLVADEECGVFATLCNEIYALADAAEKAAQSADESGGISKSAMIDLINSMSDGADILDKIYADIKDGDVFDFTNLDSKKFEEAFKGLEPEYEKFIEMVSASPNDLKGCQEAFNDLITKWIESKGVLEGLTEENADVTASMLRNMGVANAQEIVENTLIRQKAEAIAVSKEYTNASDAEKQAMLDELGAGELLRQEILRIALQKQLANANALDTSGDINAICLLAQAAGFGAESLYNLAEARAFLMEAEAGGDIDQINEAKEAVRRIVALERQKLENYAVEYGGADASNKSSSKSEKDPWLEEYKRKLKELENMLAKGRRTCPLPQ